MQAPLRTSWRVRDGARPSLDAVKDPLDAAGLVLVLVVDQHALLSAAFLKVPESQGSGKAIQTKGMFGWCD